MASTAYAPSTSSCSRCAWTSDSAAPTPHYLQLVAHMETRHGSCTHPSAPLRDALGTWCRDCGEVLSGWRPGVSHGQR